MHGCRIFDKRLPHLACVGAMLESLGQAAVQEVRMESAQAAASCTDDSA
jgi:hypothetical protein